MRILNDICDISTLPIINEHMPWLQHHLRRSPIVLQSGTGMMQNGSGLEADSPLRYAKYIIENLPKYLDAADTLTFGPIGTSISNTLSEYYNKNPKWKPGFSGEKHLVLPTQYGLTRANFAGPGTNLDARLARGDEGVDGPFGIDSAAKKHDISYALAKNYDDIRIADDKFKMDVKNSDQNPFLKMAVEKLIDFKQIGEDVGLISKDRYLTDEQKKSFGSSGGSINIPKIGKGQMKFEIKKDNRRETDLYPAQALLKKLAKKKKKPKKRSKK